MRGRENKGRHHHHPYRCGMLLPQYLAGSFQAGVDTIFKQLAKHDDVVQNEASLHGVSSACSSAPKTLPFLYPYRYRDISSGERRAK